MGASVSYQVSEWTLPLRMLLADTFDWPRPLYHICRTCRDWHACTTTRNVCTGTDCVCFEDSALIAQGVTPAIYICATCCSRASDAARQQRIVMEARQTALNDRIANTTASASIAVDPPNSDDEADAAASDASVVVTSIADL